MSNPTTRQRFEAWADEKMPLPTDGNVSTVLAIRSIAREVWQAQNAHYRALSHCPPDVELEEWIANMRAALDSYDHPAVVGTCAECQCEIYANDEAESPREDGTVRHLNCATARLVEELREEVDRLRCGPPGRWPTCTDCGRAMVWQYDGSEGRAPSWMCPNCVLRRADAAEKWVRGLDAETRRLCGEEGEDGNA